MNTEGEQQEAVCGTCGGSGELWLGERVNNIGRCGECGGTGRIPAPVVPSDDALCDECGHVLTWGCHGPAQDRLISILGGELEFPHPFHAPGTGGMYADKRKAAAPPTPSQDAEGDRRLAGMPLRALWDEYALRCNCISVECEHTRAIESSIRADYEELMKAARDARSALVLLTSELSGQIGYIEGLQQRPHGQPQRAIDHAHEVGARVDTALTRIEESLGGRKDG